MFLKEALRKNKWVVQTYRRTKDYFRTKGEFTRDYHFDDRSKHQKKLCMMLCGYKEYLMPAVLGRLEKFLEPDIDVCIVTSGLFSEKLAETCREKGWSYLSLKRNNVSLAQNMAIRLHPDAEYIFKLDEDILLTEGYFEKMMRALQHAETGDYSPGVIAPLIPVNGFGYRVLLDRYGLADVYAQRFEKPIYMSWDTRKIQNDPETAKFFWGEPIQIDFSECIPGKELNEKTIVDDDIAKNKNIEKERHKAVSIPGIDQMNRDASELPVEERPCPIRFSIGAILFRRKFWEKIHHFPVGSGIQLGLDEEYLSKYCAAYSRPVMVSMNVVVGHLAFGMQNKVMKEYYLAHPEKFVL